MNLITRVLFTLMAFILIGCSKDDPLRLVQRGYLSLNTEFVDFSTSKVDVPECSSLTPDNVKVRLINSEGLVFTTLTNINIVGNQVNLTEPLTLPVGTYTVDEISLMTESNIVTHSVPNVLDNRFDFALYTQNPLPYDITINPEATTNVNAQVMCYSEEDVLNAPTFDWFSEIIDLQTFAFNLPESSCIDQIRIQVNLDIDGEPITRTINILLYKKGLYRIPIPVEFNYVNLAVYRDGFIVRSWAFNDYNVDGVLDATDVIQIPDKCP